MIRVWLVSMLVLSIVGISRPTNAAPELQQDVLPLLKLRCVQCHGPNLREGGLNLSLPQTIARGGENGLAVIAGNLEDSLLWRHVSNEEMPPEEPLPDDEKNILRRWIQSGALGLPEDVSEEPKGDEHWAYQPFQSVPIPAVQNTEVLCSPIDNFIQAKLESLGLTMAQPADRRILIRRVALDLTGLPPSLDEIRRYLEDNSENAYEKMVDRYLASSAYGERWGKYWLDAAGYADSNGYFGADTDRPLAYRYRDYVIRSFNEDKPFDQFIREQLAGDEIAQFNADREITPKIIELLEATHYLRNSPDGTDSSDGNPDELRADKYAVIEGTMQIIGSSLLGLTVQCARCHDHKFEPFTQKEYYQLQAVLYPAFHIEEWVKPKDRKTQAITDVDLKAWQKHSQEIDARITSAQEAFWQWIKTHRVPGKLKFIANFDAPNEKLAASWSNAAPGDTAAAGQPGVNIDSSQSPGALIVDQRLNIVESRDDGDRAFSTKEIFDWTPDEEGAWVEVTFDLIAEGEAAPYVGYFISLNDFNDSTGSIGGNILIDGSAKGGATVHVDYPGPDSDSRGRIGKSGYTPNKNYGVRVTNIGDGKFELHQVVNGLPEENIVTLTSADLPDGGFGFEYCCGRSFVVDNVRIESSSNTPGDTEKRELYHQQLKQRQKDFDETLKSLEKDRGAEPGYIATVRDVVATTPEVHFLERGNYKTPAGKVTAAAPKMVSEEINPQNILEKQEALQQSTGHRLALAQWLTKPDSRSAALLARVTVNRWWHHRFGTGIVNTTDNLGYSGGTPSHRELLDYLATELATGNWSAKAIHRLIVCSAVYRQSSVGNSVAKKLNPDNRLLWRYPLRRLDAEAIRDSMLAISGELDRQQGGPYVPTTRSEDGDVVINDEVDGALRRSIYLQQRRTQVLGMLEVFDAPSIVFNCTARPQTTVPLQSLKLLNSDFILSRAAALNRRITAEGGPDSSNRLQRAFELVTGKQPTPSQLTAALDFIARQTDEYAGRANATELVWNDFCQSILSSNAFLFVR